MAALSVWRVSEFGQIEPRQDQAAFQQWVRALNEAERWLPHREEGQTWRVALEADGRSALYALFQQIYVAPVLIFTLLSVVSFALASAVLGASFAVQVILSIVSSALTLGALALIPLAGCAGRASAAERKFAVLVGAIATAFGAGSSFLNIFSPLGVHNFAVFMLMLVVLAVTRWLTLLESDCQKTRIRWAAILALAAYTATLFANHATALLCPPAVALAILCADHLALRRRLLLITGLVVWTVIVFLPVWILLWLSLQPDYLGDIGQGLFVVGRSPFDIGAMSRRAEDWFLANLAFFSAPGLALAGVGLFGLAFKNRMRLPMLLAALHAAYAMVVPAFAQFDRTSVYLIPILCLGAGWAVATPIWSLLKRPRVNATWAISGTVVVSVLVAMHLTKEIPRLVDPLKIAPWGAYLAHQGDWRPMQREIETLPEGAILIPWDYQISHIYGSLRPNDGRGPALFVPLSTLLERQRNGTLTAYIARRRITLAVEAPVFLLGPSDDIAQLTQRVSAAFQDAQFEAPGSPIGIEVVRDWRNKSWPIIYPSLVLYRVVRPAG